ncbi:TetR/AcrR family transcriptional regulator [Streptomyces sp. NPDC053499]|uniref:TetR/AcrR family transcriptional regulator n=1 Tax=Streptomyces sp. NPDC053499 TaxID=3365707 RepID=UPI0037D510E2
MARRRYHHGDLRTALLDAAEALVRERGTQGWSLREASARVGVSPSAAYHHFASRDVLVRAVSERVLARLGTRMSEAAGRASYDATEDDPLRRIVAVGRGYVRWAVEEPAVARLVFGAGVTDSESAISPHPHDVLAAELDRLLASGGLTASAREGAEFVVWAAVHGLAMLLIDGLMRLDGTQEIDREAERVVRAVVRGLTTETAPPLPWPAPRSAHTEHLAAVRFGTAAPGEANEPRSIDS